jgi:hypothetical protein
MNEEVGLDLVVDLSAHQGRSFVTPVLQMSICSPGRQKAKTESLE